MQTQKMFDVYGHETSQNNTSKFILLFIHVFYGNLVHCSWRSWKITLDNAQSRNSLPNLYIKFASPSKCIFRICAHPKQTFQYTHSFFFLFFPLRYFFAANGRFDIWMSWWLVRPITLRSGARSRQLRKNMHLNLRRLENIQKFCSCTQLHVKK